MKIVHSTTVHARNDVRILQKECTTLTRNFGDVTLIVGDGGGDIENKALGVSRILDIGPAPKSRLGRMLRQPFRMLRFVRQISPDVFHFHDPELLLIGWMLKKSGIRVIYDAHEDVPRQILGKHWIPLPARAFVSWLFERVENFVAHRVSGVVAATPHIAARFQRVNRNTVNINNYPLPDELVPSTESGHRKRQVCYVGGISRIRGIRPLVDALPLLPDLRLVLCGRFVESDLEAELRFLPGWQQVDYRGQVDRDEVRKVLTESVAGVVTLFPTPNYLDSLPIKMFEYMSAELPVIASDFPLWRQIIDDAGAGICVDPQDPHAIALAIRQLADDAWLADKMGKAGREAVITRYNWTVEGVKLIDFYKDLS